MSTLTGAAKNTRDRSVLMDTARARTADRDPAAPGDVEALLRSVYALTPAKARRKLDAEGVMGEWQPKEGPTAWLAEQRGDVDTEPIEGWGRRLLAEAMARPIDLDVFTGAFLSPDEPTSVYYGGHGIGHQYRPDVAR